MTNRRSVLQSGLAALAALPAATLAQQLPAVGEVAAASEDPALSALDKDSQAVTAAAVVDLERYVKLIGSLNQEAVYTVFEGLLWAVVPDQTPTPICGFHTLARHEWLPRDQGSFLQQRFELGYFSALDDDVPAATLVNPLTEEEVAPFHYRRGGGQRLFSPGARAVLDADGNPLAPERLAPNWQSLAGNSWLTEQHSGEYPAPFAAEQWPRESAGERYFHASETTYSAATAQLDDPAIKSVAQQLYWSSVTSWEPWLLMADAPGFVMWRGVGAKLGSPLDAPEALRNYALGQEPRFFAPGVPWVGQKTTAEQYQQERQPVPFAQKTVPQERKTVPQERKAVPPTTSS